MCINAWLFEISISLYVRAVLINNISIKIVQRPSEVLGNIYKEIQPRNALS